MKGSYERLSATIGHHRRTGGRYRPQLFPLLRLASDGVPSLRDILETITIVGDWASLVFALAVLCVVGWRAGHGEGGAKVGRAAAGRVGAIAGLGFGPAGIVVFLDAAIRTKTLAVLVSYPGLFGIELVVLLLLGAAFGLFAGALLGTGLGAAFGALRVARA